VREIVRFMFVAIDAVLVSVIVVAIVAVARVRALDVCNR